MGCNKQHVLSIFLSIICLTSFSCGKDAITRQRKIELDTLKSAESHYNSPDWTVRQKGILEVHRLLASGNNNTQPNQNIMDFLIRATSDTHAINRIEAIKGLTTFCSNIKVLNHLKELSVKEDNDNVRWFALMVLSESRSPEALPVYIDNFNSSDWLIREACIKGMLFIRDESIQERITPFVIKALHDPVSNIQITALENISFQNGDLYKNIRRYFHHKEKPGNSMIKAALHAIKGYDLDPETEEKIIRLLTHPNKNIRILALRALKGTKKDSTP